jgi:hypothetical protein
MRVSPAQTGVSAAVVVAAALVFSLMALLAGCAGDAPEVHKEALYTPESLARELAFRYRALSPEAMQSQSKSKAKTSLADRQRDDATQRKGGIGATTTKKRSGASTVDDLVADIGNKLMLVKGISRADACRKMIDTFSNDSSLTAGDKKALTEIVGRLADQR